MKNYHLYVFSQDKCAPCKRLKDHISGLSEAEQAELDIVPYRAENGERTALAEELEVELTPTLVVVHQDILCDLDETGDEFCDYQEFSVERFVGANSIIEHLPATIDAYTYVNPE